MLCNNPFESEKRQENLITECKGLTRNGLILQRPVNIQKKNLMNN